MTLCITCPEQCRRIRSMPYIPGQSRTLPTSIVTMGPDLYPWIRCPIHLQHLPPGLVWYFFMAYPRWPTVIVKPFLPRIGAHFISNMWPGICLLVSFFATVPWLGLLFFLYQALGIGLYTPESKLVFTIGLGLKMNPVPARSGMWAWMNYITHLNSDFFILWWQWQQRGTLYMKKDERWTREDIGSCLVTVKRWYYCSCKYTWFDCNGIPPIFLQLKLIVNSRNPQEKLCWAEITSENHPNTKMD